MRMSCVGGRAGLKRHHLNKRWKVIVRGENPFVQKQPAAPSTGDASAG